MSIGHKIKNIREIRRISQKELAENLNVSQKTISNFESCKTIPSIYQLIEMSNLLHYDFIKNLKTTSTTDNSFNDRNPKTNSELNWKNLISRYEIIVKDKEEIIRLLKDRIAQLEKYNSYYEI